MAHREAEAIATGIAVDVNPKKFDMAKQLVDVAKMAGVPLQVLQRADLILTELEKNRSSLSGKETVKNIPKSTFQMNMFQVDDPAMGKVRQMLEANDINRLSPVEALLMVNEMKKILKE